MSRAAKRLTLDDLPLFASDEDIGEAVLGPDRKKDFAGFAALLERQGMPKVSPFWGGRYVPAVKQWLDFDNGISELKPTAPGGVEGTWPTTRRGSKAQA